MMHLKLEVLSSNISKAFNKVWHEGIIFKIKPNGVSDDPLNILLAFLRNKTKETKSYV